MATFLEYCCYQYCTSMSELANTSVTPASRQSATITTPITAASSEDQVLAPLQCGAMRHAPDGRKVRKILMERTSTVLLLGRLVRKDSYSSPSLMILASVSQFRVNLPCLSVCLAHVLLDSSM